MKEMTRELWAKYEWMDCTRYNDFTRMYENAYERTPTEAKRAWDEYEVFEKLWKEEQTPAK